MWLPPPLEDETATGWWEAAVERGAIGLGLTTDLLFELLFVVVGRNCYDDNGLPSPIELAAFSFSSLNKKRFENRRQYF